MPSWDTSHVSYPLWYDRVRYSLSTHLIVGFGFWLPDLESDYLELWSKNGTKYGKVVKFRPWKPAEKVLYSMLHLQWKLRVTPVAPPWGLCLGSSAPMSLDRPQMGAMKSETISFERFDARNFMKFHQSREEAQCDGCYGDGHARQKVILQDALHLVFLRCRFHAVTRPRKPICQVSLALWTKRISLLRSSFENEKTHPNFLKKKQQHEKWRIWAISEFSGHEVKWVKCQISTEGGAELGHETVDSNNYGHPPSRFDGQHQPRFKATEWPEKIHGNAGHWSQLLVFLLIPNCFPSHASIR